MNWLDVNVGVRRAPVGVVEDVGELQPQLRPDPANLERLEEREVHVPDRRPAELVLDRGAQTARVEAGRLREQALVVPVPGQVAHTAGGLRIALDVDVDRAAPGQFIALFVPLIENGVPVNSAKMPLTCQPPNILAVVVVLSFRNGSSYAQPIWKTCVRSNPDDREVVVVHHRVVEGERGPTILVRHVMRLAQGVGALQHEALPERPVERTCRPCSAPWFAPPSR